MKDLPGETGEERADDEQRSVGRRHPLGNSQSDHHGGEVDDGGRVDDRETDKPPIGPGKIAGAGLHGLGIDRLPDAYQADHADDQEDEAADDSQRVSDRFNRRGEGRASDHSQCRIQEVRRGCPGSSGHGRDKPASDPYVHDENGDRPDRDGDSVSAATPVMNASISVEI